MGSKRQVRKAPPKPVEPPCPYCDEAYWRYDGYKWYACDRVSKRLHRCTSLAATVAAEEQAQRSAAAAKASARSAARTKLVLYLVAGAVVVLIGWGWFSSRHVYRGPSDGTAECSDGTISYAMHHQGACSWHGGVYAWN